MIKREESTEDYLETILLLKKRQGMVRSIDVVNETGYSKPSISIAMKHLREKEYILMEENGYIEFTESGRQKAEQVLERHTILTEILMMLGVRENTAREDACRMEHDISEESFERIKEFLEHNNK